MEWHELFPRTRQPEPSEIEAYIESPLWAEFCGWLQAAYAAGPLIQYSVCSGAPGWNVKFRKGSRAICTNYPRRGYFTCLVCIGGREAAQAELLLPACGSYVRELYFSVQPFNGARWLMINVDSPAVLNDLKRLVSARMGTPKARKATNEI